jgi:hypothetical protein
MSSSNSINPISVLAAEKKADSNYAAGLVAINIVRRIKREERSSNSTLYGAWNSNNRKISQRNTGS